MFHTAWLTGRQAECCLGQPLLEDAGCACVDPTCNPFQLGTLTHIASSQTCHFPHGLSAVYNSAAAGFEERQLAASLQQAAGLLEHQQRQQQHHHEPWQLHQSDASSGGRAASSSSAGSRSSSSWTVSTGAELAALAHLALMGRLDAAELAIRREWALFSRLPPMRRCLLLLKTAVNSANDALL